MMMTHLMMTATQTQCLIFMQLAASDALLQASLPLGYIDPGVGSQMLQWLAAGLLSSLYLLKMSWSHIKARLTQRTEKPHD